ncbi:MAG: alanine--tRNA ligase [Traorella sp.]
MKQLTGNEIRQLFLDYFKSKGHMVEPGASLVPHNDPTLLWINAGVAALKKYFDGSEKPKCNRITNAQKSIRTNDIENVGKTARHHTFFEMLGNFSIGDYFRDEAIPYAWEFLTDPKWIGFPKEKLYVTVYTDDNESYRIWTEVCGVDPSHILRTDDNFWEIGEGPCGPDTEIFFDRGEEYDPLGLGEKLFFEEMENDRYIEVWNVVFSQYNAKAGVKRSEYKELPQKNIDTGMGLERLVSLVQGGETNFDTDLFLPIIHATEKVAKYPYEGDYKMAYRVIADHIRTVTFALADGALFSNEGRGYVLRRVLRRAVRYGKKLKIEGSFMYQLVPVVIDIMKDFYPYLVEKTAYIQKLVKAEEERFHATLNEGEKLMKDVMESSNDAVIQGDVAFKLYDTYGFPFELTCEMAQEEGYRVDVDGFNQEMEKQRERARSSRDASESMKSQSADLMDCVVESEFIGYDHITCESKVVACFKNGCSVDFIDDEGDVILDNTCFYAESGGQVADTGLLRNDNMSCKVSDVKKAPHGQGLHHVVVTKGRISINDQVFGQIDAEKRRMTTRNHSACHLLQSALKKVLGNHIAQAGSYVCSEYVRFDFTHFEKINENQLREVECLVNQFIAQKNQVVTELLPIEEAKKTNATALFDEKYGDIVRVVTMGDVSKEFCGGCHVKNTSELGVFKIESEESVGSGIRRIVGKTSYAAYEAFVSYEDTLKELASMLKLNGISKVSGKVAQLIEEKNELQKQCAELNAQLIHAKASEYAYEAVEKDNLKYLVKTVHGLDGNAMKNLSLSIMDALQEGVVFLGGICDEKVVLVARVSKKGVALGIHAGNLIKLGASVCDGKGGGKPDLAQGGGKNCLALDETMKTIKNNLGLGL